MRALIAWSLALAGLSCRPADTAPAPATASFDANADAGALLPSPAASHTTPQPPPAPSTDAAARWSATSASAGPSHEVLSPPPPLVADAAPPPPPAAPRCPATYGAAGPSCDDARARELDCHYAQGDCSCGEEPRCSGVPRPPEPPTWVCSPKRAPCPAPGGPCKGNGECGPFCCGMGVACRHGRWEAKIFPCPP